MTLVSPQTELDRLHEHSAKELARYLALIQRARLAGDLDLMDRRINRLGEKLGTMLAAADLLGRRRLLLELRSIGSHAPVTGAQFAATPIVPPLEAIKDILSRHPVLAEGWKETAAAWNAHGFALARSSSLTVTKSVQDSIVRFLRGGLDLDQAQGMIRRQMTAGGTPFTRAYSETVFRTVTSSAYQAGRADQAQKPAVLRAASGWRYQATLDSDVRENHKAGDDFIAHTQDPVWAAHAPPNGFNCRCTVELVPTSLMVELGLSHEDGSLRRLQHAPVRFVPDPGFTKAVGV